MCSLETPTPTSGPRQRPKATLPVFGVKIGTLRSSPSPPQRSKMDFSEPNRKSQNCPSSVHKSIPAPNAAGHSSPPEASSRITPAPNNVWRVLQTNLYANVGPTSIETMDGGPARFGTSAQQNAGRTTPTSLASLATSEPRNAAARHWTWTSSTASRTPCLMTASAESRFHAGTSSESTIDGYTNDTHLELRHEAHRHDTDVGVLQSSTTSMRSSFITSLSDCPSVDLGDGLHPLERPSVGRWWRLCESLDSRLADRDHSPSPFYHDATLSRDVAVLAVLAALPFHDDVLPENPWLVDSCCCYQLLGYCLHHSVKDNLKTMMAMPGSCTGVQEALVMWNPPAWISLTGSMNIRHHCQDEGAQESVVFIRFSGSINTRHPCEREWLSQKTRKEGGLGSDNRFNDK
jgi:hypothetical protein